MEKDYILIHGKIKNINKSDDKFIWFTIFKNNYYEKDGVKNDNPSFFSARVSKDSSLKDLIKLDKNVKVEGIPCGYIDKKGIRQNYIHVTTIDNQEKIMYGYDYDGVEIFNGQRCESLPASPEEIAEMEAMINDICNNTRKDVI